MEYLDTLMQRNEDFAAQHFKPDMTMLPSGKTLIIGCVDPRVDPAKILGLEQGEAAVIRNVGGRVNPALLETMALLRTVTQAAGGRVGPGSNLIVMHHTDCGIRHCNHHAPKLLAKHLGANDEDLDALAVDDPYQSVAVDVAALKANPNLPAAYTVTGLVYDVDTGKVRVVVPPARLREDDA